jgi:anti-sigma factor RsiW
MKQKDLDKDPALPGIEAMADGSLRGDQRRRMREAMLRDTALRAAVERASSVHAGLRQLRAAPVPAGLLRRLLAVPGTSPRRPVVWSWIALPVAGIAAAAAVTVLIVSRPATETVADDQRQMAVRDFALAMTYLQKSAAHTGDEVTGIVGAGLLSAFTASRDSLLNEDSDDDNGG